MSLLRHPLTASAALLLGALFWGGLVPMMWSLLQVYDIWTLGAVRYLIALPFLVLFAWLWGRAGLQRPWPWRRMAQLGAPMAVFAVIFNLGIAHSHPVTASIVLMCGPLTYTVIGRAMVGSPIPSGFAVALGLTLLGGIVTVLGDPGKSGKGIGLQGGEPLLILAQTTWAWYSIRAQQWLGNRGQFALSLLPTIPATFYLVAAWLVLLALGQVQLPQRAPTLQEWAFVTWSGATGVAFAVVLWNFGVSRLALPVASLHNNAIPVFAALAAVAIGVEPSWQQIAGGLIVLSGVAYLQLRQLMLLRAAARR